MKEQVNKKKKNLAKSLSPVCNRYEEPGSSRLRPMSLPLSVVSGSLEILGTFPEFMNTGTFCLSPVHVCTYIEWAVVEKTGKLSKRIKTDTKG